MKKLLLKVRQKFNQRKTKLKDSLFSVEKRESFKQKKQELGQKLKTTLYRIADSLKDVDTNDRSINDDSSYNTIVEFNSGKAVEKVTSKWKASKIQIKSKFNSSKVGRVLKFFKRFRKVKDFSTVNKYKKIVEIKPNSHYQQNIYYNLDKFQIQKIEEKVYKLEKLVRSSILGRRFYKEVQLQEIIKHTIQRELGKAFEKRQISIFTKCARVIAAEVLAKEKFFRNVMFSTYTGLFLGGLAIIIKYPDFASAIYYFCELHILSLINQYKMYHLYGYHVPGYRFDFEHFKSTVPPFLKHVFTEEYLIKTIDKFFGTIYKMFDIIAHLISFALFGLCSILFLLAMLLFFSAFFGLFKALLKECAGKSLFEILMIIFWHIYNNIFRQFFPFLKPRKIIKNEPTLCQPQPCRSGRSKAPVFYSFMKKVLVLLCIYFISKKIGLIDYFIDFVNTKIKASGKSVTVVSYLSSPLMSSVAFIKNPNKTEILKMMNPTTLEAKYNIFLSSNSVVEKFSPLPKILDSISFLDMNLMPTIPDWISFMDPNWLHWNTWNSSNLNNQIGQVDFLFNNNFIHG